jgi:hypothetical protein
MSFVHRLSRLISPKRPCMVSNTDRCEPFAISTVNSYTAVGMTEIVKRLVWKQDSIPVTSPLVTVRTCPSNTALTMALRIPPVYGRRALIGLCFARNRLRMVCAVTLNAGAVKVAGLNLLRKWVKTIVRSSFWVFAFGLPGLGRSCTSPVRLCVLQVHELCCDCS